MILGTSIIVGKPTITNWLNKNWPFIHDRKLLLFSVSGTAPDHPDLQEWMYAHLGTVMDTGIPYIPLRGRLVLAQLPWWLRTMLRFAGKVSQDPEVRERMTQGFDYMDRNNLEPILKESLSEKASQQMVDVH